MAHGPLLYNKNGNTKEYYMKKINNDNNNNNKCR